MCLCYAQVLCNALAFLDYDEVRLAAEGIASGSRHVAHSELNNERHVSNMHGAPKKLHGMELKPAATKGEGCMRNAHSASKAGSA